MSLLRCPAATSLNTSISRFVSAPASADTASSLKLSSNGWKFAGVLTHCYDYCLAVVGAESRHDGQAIELTRSNA